MEWIEQLYFKEQMQTKIDFMVSVKEYQEIIVKTAVFPKEIGLAYCALGLMDEYGEFVEKVLEGASTKDILKEAGDVFWYVAALAKTIDSSFEEIMDFENGAVVALRKDITQSEYISILLIKGARIQGKAKKFYRDKDESKKGDIIELLEAYTQVFVQNLRDMNLDIPTILKLNYDKLIARRQTGTLHGDGDNREEV